MKKIFLTLLLLSFTFFIQAQENEPNINGRSAGYLIGFNAQLPTLSLADMNTRFGWFSQLGPSISYKNENNWLINIGYSVLLGNVINEAVGANLLNSQSLIIGTNGYIANIQPQMRGYTLQCQVGKVINIGTKNLDSGILLAGGVGFLQHKIHFNNGLNTTPQLMGEYAKGYDRLTNGLMLSQTVSFFRIDPKKLFNYQIGIELSEGLTQSRRNFNFDTLTADTQKRLDMFIGLKFSIFIPAYLSAKNEYYFK